MWIIIAIAVSASIVWIIIRATKGVSAAIAEDADADRLEKQALWQAEGFNASVAFRLDRSQYGIAIDAISDQIAIGISGHKPRLYSFDQLVGAEVERDGDTITKSYGRIDAQGAAIATALVGPVGMALGAKTSSSSISKNRLGKLGLKLYVADLHTPMFYIPFFESSVPVDPHSPWIVEASNELDAWHGRLRTILSGVARKHTKDATAKVVTYTTAAPRPTVASPPAGRGWAARTFGA